MPENALNDQDLEDETISETLDLDVDESGDDDDVLSEDSELSGEERNDDEDEEEEDEEVVEVRRVRKVRFVKTTTTTTRTTTMTATSEINREEAPILLPEPENKTHEEEEKYDFEGTDPIELFEYHYQSEPDLSLMLPEQKLVKWCAIRDYSTKYFMEIIDFSFTSIDTSVMRLFEVAVKVHGYTLALSKCAFGLDSWHVVDGCVRFSEVYAHASCWEQVKLHGESGRNVALVIIRKETDHLDFEGNVNEQDVERLRKDDSMENGQSFEDKITILLRLYLSLAKSYLNGTKLYSDSRKCIDSARTLFNALSSPSSKLSTELLYLEAKQLGKERQRAEAIDNFELLLPQCVDPFTKALAHLDLGYLQSPSATSSTSSLHYGKNDETNFVNTCLLHFQQSHQLFSFCLQSIPKSSNSYLQPSKFAIMHRLGKLCLDIARLHLYSINPSNLATTTSSAQKWLQESLYWFDRGSKEFERLSIRLDQETIDAAFLLTQLPVSENNIKLRYLEELIERQKTVFGHDSSEVVTSLLSKVDLNLEMERLELALTTLRQAFAIESKRSSKTKHMTTILQKLSSTLKQIEGIQKTLPSKFLAKHTNVRIALEAFWKREREAYRNQIHKMNRRMSSTSDLSSGVRVSI